MWRIYRNKYRNTYIFYFNDHSSNGECHLNWIGIDTLRQLLEECLRKPRGYSKTVFCNCLPIWKLRLRIRFCNSQIKAGFAAVLFEMCSMSIFKTQRLSVLQLTLTHGWWVNFARSVRYGFSSIVICREAKSSSITLRWSQYTYLTRSALHLQRFLGQDRERHIQNAYW